MSVPATYLEDASGYRGEARELQLPETPQQAAGLLASARVPVSIAGAGTGVTGGRVPHGGLVISAERFRRLEIHPGRTVAGAGVSLERLHEAAARSGQLYAPDPTEWTASVGGTIATNASGSRSFLYGATRKHILSLTVAMMDGSVRTFRRGDAIDFEVAAIPLPQTTKSTAGYPLRPGMDWIDLIAGSEGTLGLVCEAELQLLPATGELITGVIFFLEDEEAVASVDHWRTIPRLRMLEYLDGGSLDLMREHFPEIPSKARACLLIEQESSDVEADIDDWIERTSASDSWFAADARDRERFRRFRHALPEAVNSIVRGYGFQKLGSDYAVPIGRNLEMLEIYRRVLGEEFPGRYVVFGHIGDAHVHANILPATAEEFERGKRVMFDLARHAVSLGGTVSAEHGLGKRKAHLLALQYTPAQIGEMKDVKRRLDPHWLLSRGNLFPPPEM